MGSSIKNFDDQSPIKKGDRFVLTGDWNTNALTHWAAPFTGGEICVVPKGTVLIAAHDLVVSASGFYVRPKDYEELEKVLIPEGTRTADKYDGYSLVLLCNDIGNLAKRIPREPPDLEVISKIPISRSDYEGEAWQRWNAFPALVSEVEIETLSDELKELYRIFWYDFEVQNGGHVQFLSNWGLEFASRTILALRNHNLETQSMVLYNAMNEILKKTPNPGQLTKKMDFINAAMSEEAQKADRAYASSKPKIVVMLQEYVEKNKSNIFQIKE